MARGSGSESGSESEHDTAPLLRREKRRLPPGGTRDVSAARAACAWLRAHRCAAAGACLPPCACLAAWYGSAVEAFSWQSWATIALTLEALLLMAHNLPPDLVMLSVTVALRLLGIITEEQAWAGFSSPGILAIGVLFVVAKCLEQAGTIELLAGVFLGRTSSPTLALLQLW
jgi:hypothetical protein